MEQILVNYGPVGLLALFIIYVLKEFKSFVTTAEERCEARFKEVWEAYKELAQRIQGE